MAKIQAQEPDLKVPLISLFLLILSFSLHKVDWEGVCVDHRSYFSKVPTSPPKDKPFPSEKHQQYGERGLQIFSVRIRTSVRSSGKWKVSRISSGVLPSIIRASARLVRSTRGLSWRLSAADVSSHNFLVSNRMNFSSKVLRSYIKDIHYTQILKKKKMSHKPCTWHRQTENPSLSGRHCTVTTRKQRTDLIRTARNLMKPTIIQY